MEEVLDNTGPWHYPLLILNAVGGFTFPWRVMSMQFMAPKTQDYWCARPNDHISVEDWKALNEGVDIRCFVRDFEGSTNTSAKPCTTWEFDHSYYTRTLTEEWNAVCGGDWQPESSQSLMMAGMFGSIIFSHISDWYGRRVCILISCALSLATSGAVAISNTFWTFSLLRMANAACSGGFYTLALESVGTKKRAFVSMSGDLGWFIGLFTFAAVTYFVRDWRLIQILITIPEAFYLVFTIFLDESPKWLVSVGRFKDAERILEKIVRRNNLQKVNVDLIIKDARDKIEAENPARGTLIDLFRGFLIARTTVACALNYMTVVFIYYHLMYFTVDLGDNPYLNLIFMALTEAPISLTSYFVVKYLRRKPMYTITYIAIIASLVALLFPPESTAIRMTFASIAKLSGQVTWSVLFVHISEVYPTHVRAMMLGLVHTLSRVSAVVAPLLQMLGERTYSWMPIALNVSLCIVGWAFSFCLPETFGKTLPDTFHESKTLLRSVKDSISTRKSDNLHSIEMAVAEKEPIT